MRPVRADDYAEPLRGMIERGETEPPDEFVIDDPPQVCEECLHPDHCRTDNYCENYSRSLGNLREEEEV